MAKRRYLDGHYDSLEAAITDWQRMDPVAAQLQRPVGDSMANGFTGLCRACGEEIMDGDLRGRVERLDQAVLSLFALGVCLECRCITPFELLIRELDGEVVVQALAHIEEGAGVGHEEFEPGMRALLANLRRYRWED